MKVSPGPFFSQQHFYIPLYPNALWPLYLTTSPKDQESSSPAGKIAFCLKSTKEMRMKSASKSSKTAGMDDTCKLQPAISPNSGLGISAYASNRCWTFTIKKKPIRAYAMRSITSKNSQKLPPPSPREENHLTFQPMRSTPCLGLSTALKSLSFHIIPSKNFSTGRYINFTPQ